MAAALLAARRFARVGAPRAQTLLPAPRSLTFFSDWLGLLAPRSPEAPAAPATSQFLERQTGPDLVLEPIPGSAKIYVFGGASLTARVQLACHAAHIELPPLFAVYHSDTDPRAAEFILRHRPAAVVVESSALGSHQPGAGVGRRRMRQIYEQTKSTADSTSYRHLPGAARLGLELESHPDPLGSPEWATAHDSMYGEDKVWAAAHIVGTSVIYGDLTKGAIYRRLAALSAADLIAGCSFLFAAILSDRQPGFPMPEHEVLAAQPAYRVFVMEREASILAHAARAAAATGKSIRRLGLEEKVVVVVGGAHVAGIHRMWPTGTWRPLPEAAQRAAERKINGSLSPSRLNSPGFAVRRALVESMFQLVNAYNLLPRSAAPSDSMDSYVGKMMPKHVPEYALALVHYGSMPMLLAMLSEAQLASVFGARAPHISSLLAPFRAMHVVYAGGPGDFFSLADSMRSSHQSVVDQVLASLKSINPAVADLLVTILRGTSSAAEDLNRRVDPLLGKL